MNWIEEYENMTVKDKQLFTESTNTLLGQTYLVVKKQSDRMLYRFCERKFELIQNYFSLSGWELHHMRAKGIMFIKNDSENKRYRFSLSETIFLFILRLLYDDKVKELNLTQQVMVTNRDIWERYNALNIKDRLPAQENYRKTLRLFQSFSLLELKNGSWDNADGVMVLFPSLEVVISNTALDLITTWIENKYEGSEDDENGYTITND